MTDQPTPPGADTRTMLEITSSTRAAVERKVAELTAGEWEVWSPPDILPSGGGYFAIVILPETTENPTP